jgi:3-oxoadipate enol-lactonase
MTASDSGYLEFNGARIYYEVEGSGPPLVLIHAGVAHLRMWDEQVAAWREQFRVIRYDTRGYGRTRTEDVPYSNMDDLGAVLDAVGVKQTHLLGLSRGGLIALDFTVNHPERVRSLTWVAGGVRGLEVPDDPRLVAIWPEVERLYKEQAWAALVELETQIWTDGVGQPASRVDPDVRQRMVTWNLESYMAQQDAEQVVTPPAIAAEHLADIKLPVLLIWGTLDESSVTEVGEYLAATVPGARRHVFEGVAHMVNLERPAEFNDLVLGFVRDAEATRTGG